MEKFKNSKKQLKIFKKGIESSKKYYHSNYPDNISDEEIEKAINLLMNHKHINDYLRRVKKYEDSRVRKYKSNHCEICNKAYASFGFKMLINKYGELKEETIWYCLEHKAYGKLEAINNELEHKQERSLDDLYKLFQKVVDSLTNKFRREYEAD